MNTDILASRDYARTITNQSNLNLIEEGDKWCPRTDGRNIYMPSLKAWDKDDPKHIMWYGALIHECRHNSPENREVFDILKKRKIYSDSLLGYVTNIVDDYQIEHNSIGEFPGRDSYASKTQLLFRKSGLKKEKPHGKEEEACCDLFIWDSMMRGEWMPDMATYDWKQHAVDKYFDNLNEIKEEYNSNLTPEERYELSLKIIELLGLDPKEEEEKSRKMYEASGGGSMSKEDLKEAIKTDKSLTEEEKNELLTQLDAIVKFEDTLIHKHSHNNGASYNSLTIDYSERTSDISNHYEVAEPRIRNFVAGYSGEVDNSYFQLFNNLSNSNAISTAIKKYLLAFQKSRYHGGKRSGKVHRKSVWKTSVFSGQPTAQEIFRKKMDYHILDNAISIVIDNSGSMDGSKLVHAVHSVILLNEVFAKICIPVEIISFTDNDKGPINFIHKEFDSKISSDKICEQMAIASKKMWDNADGESILWAAQRLKKRKEKNKLMIVLSDGQPASSRSGWEIYDFTKEVVNELSKQFSIYGIGIENDTVKEFYKEWDVINDSSELESTLLNLLKRKVIKHA